MPSPSPAQKLLRWYDRHARVLPWRAPKGARQEPYRVWLSEIMLQQTTVQAVASYYRKFLERWPTVEDLAAAPLDDVLAAWAGLGYYARARNLHKAAQAVAGKGFPDTYEGLRALPGIGEYTAGAIAAIAFDLPHAAMDANAERVVARLFAVTEPLAKVKPRLRALGQSLVPPKRAGDFAQAMMDLGSAICTPRRPACMSCPLFEDCAARKLGIQETLPAKGEKPLRPLKRGAAFVARDAAGAVLLIKRPERGLLGGMLQPPLGPWTDEFPSQGEALAQAPFKAEWKKRLGVVRHGFTHFELEIEVYEAQVAKRPDLVWDCHSRPSRATRGEGKGTQVPHTNTAQSPGSPSLGPPMRASPGMTEGIWIAEGDLAHAALPTVMRKIVNPAPGSPGNRGTRRRSS
jgi:A/G-specific adenine glycosylase